ncbi:hypothetical protein DBR24_01435 [Pseudomonas sp. HMWF006]|nr:hypothetical protein DBR24_01435 [Pseudomonas sp. HMWF006]PTT70091.1 hypothetical protein DBR26_10305 [Pseudomonas sp. HMWF007]PTT92794.1 hypothetical protein DBR29_08450 [Pseudomonas sp. HMWF005]
MCIWKRHAGSSLLNYLKVSHFTRPLNVRADQLWGNKPAFMAYNLQLESDEMCSGITLLT